LRSAFLPIAFVVCCACTSPKKTAKVKTKGTTSPASRRVFSLNGFSRSLVALHGGLSKPDALSKECKEAWDSLPSNSNAELFIIDDIAPLAFIRSKTVFISHGLISLLGRRSLDVERKPFEPGRGLLALMAHMKAHLELHSEAGLLKDSKEGELDKNQESQLIKGALKLRTASQFARRFRNYRAGCWPVKLCTQADQRAMEILAARGIPKDSLVEAYRALLPIEPLFGSGGERSIFVDRHVVTNQRLTTLTKHMEGSGEALTARQVSRGQALGRRAQNLRKLWKAELSFRRALAYERRGFAKEAREKAILALKTLPQNVALLTCYGRLSLSLEKEQEGEIFLRRALSINPEYIPARIALADLFLKRSWLEAADSDLELALQLAPFFGAVYGVKARLEAHKKSLEAADYQALFEVFAR
jgi:tetratricopeptide (TPR) repeat protein